TARLPGNVGPGANCHNWDPSLGASAFTTVWQHLEPAFLTLRRAFARRVLGSSPQVAPRVPTRRCPRQCMFLAAFWLRSKTRPQEGQRWVRTQRLFCTRAPHLLQSWLVC